MMSTAGLAYASWSGSKAASCDVDNTAIPQYINTVDDTIDSTVDNTRDNTIDNTVDKTIDDTIDNTIDNTVGNTVDNTIVPRAGGGKHQHTTQQHIHKTSQNC